MPKKSVCKFCNKLEKMVRAHIYPKSFHRQMAQGEPNDVKILPRDHHDFPRRRPGGLYDDQLVCKSCEQIFSPYDDYGYRFFTEIVFKYAKPIDNEIDIDEVINFDYSKLKLFILSILWRVSNSSNELFESVSIDEAINQKLIEMIKQGNPGDADEFSIMISQIKEERARLVSPAPHSIRFYNRIFLRLYLGGFILDIKIDQENFGDNIPNIFLSPSKPLLIPRFRLQDSEVYRDMFKRFIQNEEGDRY